MERHSSLVGVGGDECDAGVRVRALCAQECVHASLAPAFQESATLPPYSMPYVYNPCVLCGTSLHLYGTAPHLRSIPRPRQTPLDCRIKCTRFRPPIHIQAFLIMQTVRLEEYPGENEQDVEWGTGGEEEGCEEGAGCEGCGGCGAGQGGEFFERVGG